MNEYVLEKTNDFLAILQFIAMFNLIAENVKCKRDIHNAFFSLLISN